MTTSEKEMKAQDMVDIPDEYFKLDKQRKETIDEVIKCLYKSQKRSEE